MKARTWGLIAAGTGAVIAAARLTTTLTRRHARRAALEPPKVATDPTKGVPRPWIIMNPSKHEDPQAFRDLMNEAATRHGITHVHWLETTREDPGTGQAIRALALGASVVIAAGGDGTVRAVAAGMANSRVRMGIIPVGTGNVLAGNLAIPEDPVAALDIALGPHHRPVDLAWVRVEDVEEASPLPAEGRLVRLARAQVAAQTKDSTPPDDPREDEYSSLVVAGMGFDGVTMADTDPALKKRIGWIAYVWAALGAINSERMRAHLRLHSPRTPAPSALPLGDAITATPAPSTHGKKRTIEETTLEARSIMFANAGELKMLLLAPDASLSDGLIDVIAVDARAGMLGWADVTWKMLGQMIGLRPVNLPESVGTVAFRQARGASVSAHTAQVCQVDGDAIGRARTMHVRMSEGALDVAVPAQPTWMDILPA